MIKLQYRDQPHRYVNVSANSVTLGCDPTNDLVIDDSTVSDFHAEIINDQGSLFIVDLLSAGGTFVNENRIGSRRYPLNAWDQVQLGTVIFEINDPSHVRPDDWALLTVSDLGSGRHQTLKPVTLVGRDPECDLMLNDPLLSRRHAEITIEGSRLNILDLDSANGTFLNGEVIKQASAKPEDELRFGSHRFTIVGPSRVLTKPEFGVATMHDSMGGQSTGGENLIGASREPAHTKLLLDNQLPGRLIECSNLLDGDKEVELHQPSYSLGRSDENDIVLRDGSVSRVHARITRQPDHWLIEDNQSSNGVVINGLRVNRAVLSHGDTIVLGRAEFVFENEEQ